VIAIAAIWFGLFPSLRRIERLTGDHAQKAADEVAAEIAP